MILCILFHYRCLGQSKQTKSIFVLLERPVCLEFLFNLDMTADKQAFLSVKLCGLIFVPNDRHNVCEYFIKFKNISCWKRLSLWTFV